MIVTCEQCQARFKLADEKIKPEGTKVRCSKCQSIFTVFPPPPPAPAEQIETEVTPPAAAAEPPFEAGPAAAEAEPPDKEPPPESAEDASGGMEFDFGEHEQAASAEEETGSISFDRPAADDERLAGEFDFEAAFGDEESAPSAASQPAGESAGFDFGEVDVTSVTAADDTAPATAEPDSRRDRQGEVAEEFFFDEDPPTAAATGEFDFTTGTGGTEATAEEDSTEFDFATEDAEGAGFGEISFDEEEESFSPGALPGEESADFGTETSSWGTPGSAELDSFDFEEPKFDGPAAASDDKTSSLSFGEIDFSDDEGEAPLPSFDSPPDFRPPVEQPQETVVPKPPEAVAPPLQPTSRTRSEIQPPPAPLPRRSPASTMVVALGVVLLVLCSAGGYLYMSGDGERLVNQVIMKIKGEKPAGPVEQLIGFSNIVTSYVDNREAGQLLVVQGVVTNNFPTHRSAIAVKGQLLDPSGKVVKQQTVYCGNFLKEEKLRTLPFAAIEEAMNNQIGDSLSNMNVKPGASLKFTIVFRDVPENIANINFEVVDSKPGSS